MKPDGQSPLDGKRFYEFVEEAKKRRATASRIAERCGEYQIVVGRDRRKNQRFSMNDT